MFYVGLIGIYSRGFTLIIFEKNYGETREVNHERNIARKRRTLLSQDPILSPLIELSLIMIPCAREKKEKAKGPTATNKYEGEQRNSEHENERKREKKNGEGEIGGSGFKSLLKR